MPCLVVCYHVFFSKANAHQTVLIQENKGKGHLFFGLSPMARMKRALEGTKSVIRVKPERGGASFYEKCLSSLEVKQMWTSVFASGKCSSLVSIKLGWGHLLLWEHRVRDGPGWKEGLAVQDLQKLSTLCIRDHLSIEKVKMQNTSFLFPLSLGI